MQDAESTTSDVGHPGKRTCILCDDLGPPEEALEQGVTECPVCHRSPRDRDGEESSTGEA